MFNLFERSKGWLNSEYCALPRVPAVGDDCLRDYCLIAGGLALVLSRCPRSVAARRFRAASRLYLELDKKLRGRGVGVDPQLICEVSHEVAEFTDRATRDALLRRMRKSS